MTRARPFPTLLVAGLLFSVGLVTFATARLASPSLEAQDPLLRADAPEVSEYSMLLEVSGLDGGSDDARMPAAWIVSEYAFGITRPEENVGGGGSTDSTRASFGPLQVRIEPQSGTPGLILAAASGRPLAAANLSVRDFAGVEVLRIEIRDVVVLGFEEAGSAREGDDLPNDLVSFGYSRIRYTRQTLAPDGSAGAPQVVEWDLATSTARRTPSSASPQDGSSPPNGST